ncbi:MAG: DNA polymerase III subunit epsilon [Gammaproteobacteria bacterium]
MRQIVLDTETTGLEPSQGHRIIEVGCVEVINRRLTGNNLHIYINPERDIDEGAKQVHGITEEFLADKPTFARIAPELITYLRGADLVIHNAPFDVGFLDHEFRLLDPGHEATADMCTVTDSLVMARRMHPGQRNSLDALCKRYDVDNSGRDLHGALLDAELLAGVYLAMTGGQTALSLHADDGESASSDENSGGIRRLAAGRPKLRVVRATADEMSEHEAYLDRLDKSVGGSCIWRANAEAGSTGADAGQG